MELLKETCPWCHKEVRVEPGASGATPARPVRKISLTPLVPLNAERKPSAQPAREVAAPPSDFVETPFMKDLVDRTLAYIKDGLHVHLCGPAGSGKTTLALHVAELLGRPVVLINGDDEMGTADLVGKESGYKRSYTRDDYIHTVTKVEEELKPTWVGRALTDACQNGSTVVYDEFTRSRPEANNVLLSVLEERVLPLRGKSIPVHADFRIIFTSNPAEYAGVHGAQDALLDRMVTILVKGFDQATEAAITQKRSGLPASEVDRIVALVRAFRDAGLKTSSGQRSSRHPDLENPPSSRWTCLRRRRSLCPDVQRRPPLPGSPHGVKSGRGSEKRRDSPAPDPGNLLCRPALGIPRSPIPAVHEMEPDNLMAALGDDAEIQELLLRKMRQKGLSRKLLAELLQGEKGGRTRPWVRREFLDSPTMLGVSVIIAFRPDEIMREDFSGRCQAQAWERVATSSAGPPGGKSITNRS